MNKILHYKLGILLGSALVMLGLFYSCKPVMCSRVVAEFKNCTGDTLYIGVSRYDCIDSIEAQLAPCYGIPVANLDTTEISLWKERVIKYGNELYSDERVYALKDCYIYPDSTCSIDANRLSNHDNDTCYFFLIKWKDAKQYSWDEIRTKILYRKWYFVSKSKGRYDGNIRYTDF